jgi:hypothetical protein
LPFAKQPRVKQQLDREYACFPEVLKCFVKIVAQSFYIPEIIATTVVKHR